MTIAAAANVLPDALHPFATVWDKPALEDIWVNAPGAFYARIAGKTARYECPDLDALAVEAIASFAGHLRGQYADTQSPILDAELPTGERLSIVLPPCTPAGKPSLSLRRGPDVLPSLDALDEGGLWNLIKAHRGNAPDAMTERRRLAKSMLAAGEVNKFFRYCIGQRWSIAFVGQTGSGKTTDATALVMEIPQSERIITVADTEEWARLPHPNRVSFLYKKGDKRITCETMIEASLRNAPDWLLVQEVRDGSAFAFLRGLASGHPGMTSWHAASAATAFSTLTTMVRQHESGRQFPEDALRELMRATVNVVVHVERGVQGFRATDIKFGVEI